MDSGREKASYYQFQKGRFDILPVPDLACKGRGAQRKVEVPGNKKR